MDNNFNQNGAQNEQKNNMFSNAGFGGIVNSVNNIGGAQKPNLLLGTAGALAAAVVGTIVWILVSMSGYIFGILGAGIAFLAMFLYEKLGKGIDIKGFAICIVFTLIAIWAGNRFGAVFVVKSEMGLDSYSAASKMYDYFMKIDDFSSAYYQDLIMSYVYTVVFTVVFLAARIKKGK